MATPSATATKPNDEKEVDLEQSEDHIRVVARFRPINAKEKHEEKQQNLSSEPITLYNDSQSTNIPRTNKPALQFTLDQIIWSDSTQQQSFEILAKPLVDQAIKGYNSTIFAFGQTGSGKTYTMFGPDNYSRVEQLGIIPRSVDYLFSSLLEAKDVLNYQVTLSVIEIYKEQTRDLLSTAKKRKHLEIFVSGKEVVIRNLTEQSCASVDEVLEYILKAQAARNTKKTDFIGHYSSRSHCVVMISITQRLLDDTVKTSKLNFGDLAGSELASRTGAVGDTIKEAGKIHQGLLALENVINALVQGKEHVPYKDSKLTRVLKDSLGGNSKTTLLVACSPHIWNRPETVSTLRFAARAKKIKNKAKINKRRTRNQMEIRIRQLEEMNVTLKKKLKSNKKGGKTSIQSNDTGDNDVKLKEALGEIERLKELLRQKEDRIQAMEKDLKSKDNIIEEMNNKYSLETSKFENNICERDNTIEDLQNKIFSNHNEIRRLTKQLEDDSRLQESFIKHKQQLSNMVNETISDQSNNTVEALSELQKQQKEFYLFMKNMKSNIDKIYEKQIIHDEKFEEIYNKEYNVINNSYNRRRISNSSKIINDKPTFGDILSVNEPYNDGITDDEDDDDEYLNDNELNQKMNGRTHGRDRSRLSTSSIIIPIDALFDDKGKLSPRSKLVKKQSQEAVSVVINSMKSYLEKSRTGRLDVNELKKTTGILLQEWNEETEESDAPINIKESISMKVQYDENTEDEDMKQPIINGYENIKTKQHQDRIIKKKKNNNDNDNDKKTDNNNYSNYGIGNQIDVLDSSYHWYSAKIIDIDVFTKKALLVNYKGFDDKWNEWIPLKKQFRISPHGMKSLGNGKTEGGQHALIATGYGRSGLAKNLRFALDPNCDKLLIDVSILLQGWLYKMGNWNKGWKKRWFVLRNSNNLYYYESTRYKENQYRGVIALSNIRKILPSNIGNGFKPFTQYSFDIITPSRVYHFSCLNESELKDWMSVLECLMNNSLDGIAPKNKDLNNNNNNSNNNSLDINIKADPNRFKHQTSKSANFYKLTTTPTGNANNNMFENDYKPNKHRESVIGKLRRKASRLTNIKKTNKD